MSANDILDVLNIKRDDSAQPAKKKQKVEHGFPQKGAMARELYNLLGPNTPPVSVGMGNSKVRDRKQKVSPWTRILFKPNKKNEHAPELHHWQKGSEELLKQENAGKPYFFDKFAVSLDIPDFVDEATFDRFMAEIKEREEQLKQERRDLESQDIEKKESHAETKGPKITASKLVAKIKGATAKEDARINGTSTKFSNVEEKKVNVESSHSEQNKLTKAKAPAKSKGKSEVEGSEDNDGDEDDVEGEDEDEDEEDEEEDEDEDDEDLEKNDTTGVEKTEKMNEAGEYANGGDDENEADKNEEDDDKKNQVESASIDKNESKPNSEKDTATNKDEFNSWTYQETKLLFEYCKDFELKWFAISDRFPYNRTMEELKEQFYRISSKILKFQGNANPTLIESLDSFSKDGEIDRKQYLESLLKRTPAEIAEEESLVIEARRFELAAKKMLMERSHLLTLLDSPQTSQSVQQYLSSQGLTNLYNKLMILDKQQKKKMHQKTNSVNSDPVPPSIPVAASSSSYKKDRSFQTHLLQYLAGLVKQQGVVKGEPSPIQQLLSKRLTTKEEEAYGLYYHANERLTPGVILRSTQRLPGLQQRQSVFKSVNTMLQELDIPTAGNTTWKPVMPTRKTMAKYDELIRAVVALLDVKKGKDKLEAEIELIKSQRGL